MAFDLQVQSSTWRDTAGHVCFWILVLFMKLALDISPKSLVPAAINTQDGLVGLTDDTELGPVLAALLRFSYGLLLWTPVALSYSAETLFVMTFRKIDSFDNNPFAFACF